MAGIEIVWTIVGTVVSLLVAWGVAVLSLTPEDFRAARWSFSLATLILSGMTAFWLLTTNASIDRRVSVGASWLIAVICLLPAGLLWVSRRQRMTAASQDARDKEAHRMLTELHQAQQKDNPLAVDPLERHLVIPDIATVDARVCWVVERDGGYVETNTPLTPEPFSIAMQAAVLAFRNTSRVSNQRVRARIGFLNTVAIGAVMTPCGTWLGGVMNVESLIAEPRELVVALFDGSAMFCVNDNRRERGSLEGCAKTVLPLAITYAA